MKIEFWKDKRVCVTGGAGFLGSFIVEKLYEQGAKKVFVPRYQDYDLTKLDKVQGMLNDANPNLIIHAAAKCGGLKANREFPADYFYENLMMGIPLMHAAWEYGVEKFVAIGTVCSYPKFTPIPQKEESLWDGYPEETNAPYGLAKRMLLVMAQTYRQQHNFNAITLLPTNMYGPRDNFGLESSHVIGALVNKFTRAKKYNSAEIELWGDGTPTRDFLYVEDAAEGILLATEKYNGKLPINLGSGQEISIKDMAEQIRKLVDYKGRFVWDVSKGNGQPRRGLSVERAKKHFGFQAQTSLEQGLSKTIKWFEKNC